MRRTILIAVMLAIALTGNASGQEWAQKMFEVKSHDFGSVARGSKVEYRFKFKNLYKEPIHISYVRSSCGCITPSITKDRLKTYETSEILAVYNTTSFTGARSATITVSIDRPYPAEVQLRVKGYIRTDVVFSPASVQFGSVDSGQSTTKQVNVSYAGRSGWRIEDIRSTNTNLEVNIAETHRAGGRVGYRLNVRLKEDAPVGSMKDQLILVTNDQRNPRIPLYVEGRVVPSITVSPSPLFLGTLKPGQRVTKQLVVKCKKPFKIEGIDCDDDRFTFKLPTTSKSVHLVPVTFTADEKPGKLSQLLRFRTDRGDKTVPKLQVKGEVVAAKPEAKVKEVQPAPTTP